MVLLRLAEGSLLLLPLPVVISPCPGLEHRRSSTHGLEDFTDFDATWRYATDPAMTMFTCRVFREQTFVGNLWAKDKTNTLPHIALSRRSGSLDTPVVVGDMIACWCPD